MPKPSTITTWATDPGATADPGPTRRATGFIAGKKLPSKWLNWILNQNAAWLTYLRDLHTEPEFLGQDYAWTGTHTFGTRYVRKLWAAHSFPCCLQLRNAERQNDLCGERRLSISGIECLGAVRPDYSRSPGRLESYSVRMA